MKSLRLSGPRIIGLAVFSTVLACFFRLYMLGGIDALLFSGPQPGVINGAFIRRAVKAVFFSWDIYVFALLTALIGWLFMADRRIPGFICRYRYPFAAGLFLICVLTELSGSSIGMWCESFGVKDTGLLLGASRPIRSDEWAVSMPTLLAQAYNSGDSYSYFSDTIRGSLTDYYMGFRQPVYDIAMIFRPFQLGYLFLPVGKALSFYWFGRLIALALVSFEFGMFISKRKKGLSAVFMLLVTFAPVVQWWFSTALTELLIYSMLSVVLFDRYAKEGSWLRRIPYTLGILLCAGCFIMVLYPAWQVPLVFVLLSLILYVILENRKDFSFGLKDAGVIVLGCVGTAVLLLRVFNKSSETVSIISGTAYPGARFETGGGCFANLGGYFCNIWSAFTEYVPGLLANQCENSLFTDLFPLCYIPAVIVSVRDKIKDRFLIILGAVTAFLGIYCVFGFPGFLSKITFMYNSQGKRALIIFELCNIMLLIRGMALMKKPLGRRASALASGGCVLFAAGTTLFFNRSFYAEQPLPKLALLAASAVIFAAVFYLILRRTADGAKPAGTGRGAEGQSVVSQDGGMKDSRLALGALIILIAFIGGAAVNPLRRGIDALDNVEWLREIKNVGEANVALAAGNGAAGGAGEDGSSAEKPYDSRLWLVDSELLPCTNLPLLCGRTTFNATAVYPDMDTMAILDPDGKYSDIYNRYAHITTVITEEGEAYFEPGVSEDCFVLYMTLEDAKKLGVDYITSRRDLSEIDPEGAYLTRINDSDIYYIYRLQ